MFGDRLMEKTSITGTGSFQVGAADNAVGSFKTWGSKFTSGDAVFYIAENSDGTIWERGYGTFTSGSPDTISRNLLSSSTGSLIAWVGDDAPIYVMSVPVSEAMRGRYDSAKSMFVHDARRPLTAVGAADKTVTIADIAGRFTLNTTAAQRAVNLPAGSAVGEGFSIDLRATSDVFPLAIVPAGSDAIDAGAGSATKYVNTTYWFSIFWNGSAWETTVGPAVMVKTGTFSAAANFDIKNIPSNVNALDVRFELVPSNNNVTLAMQTYGADGVLDTGGSDYSYWEALASSGAAVSGGASTSSSFSPFGALSNSAGVGASASFRANNIQAASYTKFDFMSSYFDQAGVLGYAIEGTAWRNEADRITGLKGTISAGTMTGRWRAIGHE